MRGLSLATITEEFASAFVRADADGPTWKNYLPGLGPHAEDKAVALVVDQMRCTAALAGVPIGQFLPCGDPAPPSGYTATVRRVSRTPRAITAFSQSRSRQPDASLDCDTIDIGGDARCACYGVGSIAS